MQALFSFSEFSLIVTFLLFALFFVMGYKSDKKSGGFFLIFAGFILFHSISLLVDVIPVLALAFMTPLALYLIFIGIYKMFYVEPEEAKTA